MHDPWILIVVLGGALFASVTHGIWLYRNLTLQQGEREARTAHLGALKNQLTIIRAHCSEAINLGEVLDGPASKSFARDIGFALLAAENHINGLIGPNSGEAKEKNERTDTDRSPAN
jgi:hypothetical protein